MRRRALLAIVLLVGLATGGCGYSLRPSLPAGIKSVHVPVLENRTQEAGIKDFITQALTQAVVTGARARVVRREEADATLEGTIVEYVLTPLSYDSSANVTRYRVIIGLSLTLRDLRKNGEVIWQQERIQDRADFDVAGQQTRNISLENLALQKAAQDVARTIVSFAFEGF